MSVDGALRKEGEPENWYRRAWTALEVGLGAVILAIGALVLLIVVGGLVFTLFGWWTLGIVLAVIIYSFAAVEW